VESENLLQALQREADEILVKEEIYPVMSYAWVDEGTPSDEYTGLAMWSTDAPFKPTFFNFWNRDSPPPVPTERDEVFYKAGEDFIGTMELARNALGIVLYCYANRRKPENIRNILGDEEQFWEFRAVTALWLNISSDRIRDYFIMGRFQVSTKKFKNYAQPFRMHEANEGPSAREVAEKLIPLAERLGQLRRKRNEIVHTVASRQGSNALVSLKNQREEATQTPYVARSVEASMQDRRAMDDLVETLNENHQKELWDALLQLKEWYMLLVQTASLVFEFEYWKRIGR